MAPARIVLEKIAIIGAKIVPAQLLTWLFRHGILLQIPDDAGGDLTRSFGLSPAFLGHTTKSVVVTAIVTRCNHAVILI